MFQLREKERYISYGVSQGLGLLLIFASMGESRDGEDHGKDFMATSGGILFFGSRILEIIDSSVFAYNFVSKNVVYINVLPCKSGGMLLSSFSF